MDELQHHGIKGQKWGKRRFQNKDGSLTPEGERRYGKYWDAESKDERQYTARGYGRVASETVGDIDKYHEMENAGATSEVMERWINEDKKFLSKSIKNANLTDLIHQTRMLVKAYAADKSSEEAYKEYAESGFKDKSKQIDSWLAYDKAVKAWEDYYYARNFTEGMAVRNAQKKFEKKIAQVRNLRMNGTIASLAAKMIMQSK